MTRKNEGQREPTIYRFTSNPARRDAIKLRAGFCGASGSGKSFTALAVAARLVERLNPGPLFVIDSENGSALRYAKSTRTGRGFDFMHVPLPSDDYSPTTYEGAIRHAVNEGAGVLLIDSISHEWMGTNGVLEQVDILTDAAERAGGKSSSFSSGWKTMTPIHTRFVQTMLSVPCHMIFTVRAKIAYEMRKDDRGKMKPEKVGLGPVFREGIEYEPDLFCWMSDAVLTVDKCRLDTMEPGSEWVRPGADFGDRVADWIEDVDPVTPLQRAIDRAVAERHAATDAKDPARWTAARDGLIAWMTANRIPKADGEQALQALKNASVGPPENGKTDDIPY